MELWQPQCAGCCLVRHSDELLPPLLPISMIQASPHVQDQKKDLKLSDTKVKDLQGETELAGINGEMQAEAES